jgi:SAM-dependent methyltransferase
MDRQAFLDYQAESQNWLKRGRQYLLRRLLSRYAPAQGSLRLLEVGPGVGQNLSELRTFGRVEVVESNPYALEALRTHPELSAIHVHEIPFELDSRYDVICAMDVLEHIEDDESAACWIADHLEPQGLFVATVPAYNFLFSDHDRALGHHRRYSRKGFMSVLPGELRVVSSGYFNTTLFPVAAVTRLLREVLLTRKRHHGPPRRQSSRVGPALDRVLAGIIRIEAELIVRGIVPWFGLSVYCVARKHPAFQQIAGQWPKPASSRASEHPRPEPEANV